MHGRPGHAGGCSHSTACRLVCCYESTQQGCMSHPNPIESRHDGIDHRRPFDRLEKKRLSFAKTEQALYEHRGKAFQHAPPETRHKLRNKTAEIPGTTWKRSKRVSGHPRRWELQSPHIERRDKDAWVAAFHCTPTTQATESVDWMSRDIWEAAARKRSYCHFQQVRPRSFLLRRQVLL